MRLIDAEGKQLGVIPIAEAMKLAEEAEQDLVEVSASKENPVCKIMDYGKFRYRQTKKAHEAKLKQKQIQIKEIKIRPQTDDGDYQTKLRALIRFLEDGDKTKVTLRFRGREIQNQQMGIKVLHRIRDDLSAYAVVEHNPTMEGRQMIMILAPIPKAVKVIKAAKSEKIPKAPKVEANKNQQSAENQVAEKTMIDS